MRRAVLLLALLTVLGCDDDQAVVETRPPPAPTGPAVPVLEDAWTLDAPAAPPLIVSSRDVRIGNGDVIVDLENRRVPAAQRTGGESGFLITPLHERLSENQRGGPWGLAIDPEIPFRTVAEVVYTTGQAGPVELSFLVRTEAGLRVLPIALPRYGGPARGDQIEPRLLDALGEVGALADVLAGADDAENLLAEAEGAGVASSSDDERIGERADDDPSVAPIADPTAPGDTRGAAAPTDAVGEASSSSLSLNVHLTDRGIIVSGSGGMFAEGCERTQAGDVVTVPVRDAGQGIAGLTRCLERVHRQFPREDAVIVRADPHTPFRDVARVIAAARGTEANPLFPRTMLATSL